MQFVIFEKDGMRCADCTGDSGIIRTVDDALDLMADAQQKDAAVIK